MKVSVLIPVFNGAELLGNAIRSVLCQTVQDFELIVVNDGSTDDSLTVAKSFNDPRIRVIDLAVNGGLVNALNRGIAEARGEFLARLDHDDVAHPDRFRQQIEAMAINSAVICGSAIQPFGAIRGGVMEYPLKDEDIRAAMPIVSPFAHPAVMMRTDVCRSLGYSPNAKHCEDYDLWWRISEAGVMLNLAAPLLNYRFHESQISSNHRPEQLRGMATISTENLRRVGRFRNKADLECHWRAVAYETLTSLDELESVGDWFCWLRTSFGDAGDEASNHYLRVWRGVCARQPHLGTRVWPTYKRFRPPAPLGSSDLLVFLAAFCHFGSNDRTVRVLRKLFRR